MQPPLAKPLQSYFSTRREQFQYYKPGAPQSARRKLHLAGFDLECGFDTGGGVQIWGFGKQAECGYHSEYPQGIMQTPMDLTGYRANACGLDVFSRTRLWA